MREQLVAWAGDCRVHGEIDMGEGRLSDRVNEAEILTFFDATLEALNDGHTVRLDEVEVERRDLLLIDVCGHRGDPARRNRTIADRVRLEVGPFVVTGGLHRSPVCHPLSPLAGLARFVPITDAEVVTVDGESGPRRHEVVLVNREWIGHSEQLDDPLLH